MKGNTSNVPNWCIVSSLFIINVLIRDLLNVEVGKTCNNCRNIPQLTNKIVEDIDFGYKISKRVINFKIFMHHSSFFFCRTHRLECVILKGYLFILKRYMEACFSLCDSILLVNR